MKHLRLTHFQSQQMLAALVLAGILSLGSSITFVDAATANSVGNSQDVTNLKQSRAKQLPNSVVNAIRNDIARRTQSPRGQWRVVTFNQQSWPDSCLGLAQRDEVCAQMFIENGWRVVMSNGNQTLTYRSDATGRIVRLERQQRPNRSDLPSSVANAILQAASQQTGLRTSELRIVKSEQIETDGCLGLGRPDEGCLAIATQAWEVTLEGGQQRLVYRSDPNGSQVRLNEKASTIRDAQLPRAVANSVLQEASQRTGLRSSQLRIVESRPIQGSSSCLGLPPRPGEACTEDLAGLWQVIVEGGQQRLVYHTNLNGSRLRLNEPASNIGSATNLPDAVTNAVLREASQRTGLRSSQLRLVESRRIEGSSSCLGIPPRPGEVCTADLAPLWQVTVEGREQRLVYHTNLNGSRILLNEAASNISNTSLPSSVANAVLQEASRQFNMPTSQLRIAQAEKQTWRNSCLDLERPTERCMGVMTPGWRVTVVGGATPSVFHTDDTGSRIRLNQGFSNVSEDSLPQSVADAVLREASQRTGLRPSQHRILLAKQIQGSSSCLGVSRPGEACTRDLAPLWLVIVEGGQQRLLYHTNMDGSRIRLNEGASSGVGDAKERPENPAPGKTITGVRIPANELPPPLPQNAIFRVITSGGFAGRTEEAVLLNNGQLIKRAIAPNGAGSTPQTISVSPERLEQFKRMLSMQSMAQFNGLSYPAPQGAADFMTVTITSKEGTTRYVDMVQDQLPKPLQLVMMTWNSMTRGR